MQLLSLLSASRDVLATPAVATFVRHRRDDLGAAVGYVASGALLNGVLGVVAFAVHGPFIRGRLDALQIDAARLEQVDLREFVGQPDLAASVLGNLLFGVIGFLYLVLVLALVGRWLGAGERVGTLSYLIALFWVPLGVGQSLLTVLAIGPLRLPALLAGVGLGLFNLYMAYLSARAGLGLSAGRTVLALGLALLAATLLGTLLGALATWLLAASVRGVA